MANSPSSPDREARLAAKLRENLKRRKLQARARAATGDSAPEGEGNGDVAAGRPPSSDGNA